MRYDPKRPHWEDRDRFVLSKGHCVPAQYYCMAEAAFFPMDRLINLRKLAARSRGIPKRVMQCRAFEGRHRLARPGPVGGDGHASGSSRGPGRARVLRVGDGEIQGGRVWESSCRAEAWAPLTPAL